MHEVTLNNLFPAACMKITSKSNDGTTPYQNGIGRIYYNIPKDEFIKRQENFETEITNILNTYLKYDYSDFEKCLKLYDYMISNYEYDDYALFESNDGGSYNCFIVKKGFCSQFASLYAYLLLEANVDAFLIDSFSFSQGSGHAWTYAIVNGKGYHIDPTWGLKSYYNNEFNLDYFMMTDKDREEDDDFPKESYKIPILPESIENESNVDYSATDDTYACFRYAYLENIDLEKNIIYYNRFSESREFQYE